MKQKLFIIIAAMLLVPMGIFSQTYQELWKEVEQAQRKDLPKTAMEHLQKIEAKAQKAGDYGELLKATLLTSRLQAEVAPDSLKPALERLEQEAESTKDVALKAVYCTVLSKVYADNAPHLDEDAREKSKTYREQALEHPEALARAKGEAYRPFVVNGKDSKVYYDDDLLNIVGRELGEWQWLHGYYSKTGNRKAACLTGVEAFDIDGPEITTPHGKRASRIEVKSSASVQIDTPDNKEPISLPPSQLKFSIRKAIDWQSKSKVAQRNNDLYVFAHYKATSKSDNMLDLSFWDFYVYPTYKIDGDASGLAKQNSISVYRLEMLDVPCVSFRDLFQEIKKVTDDITAHYASNWYGVELISDPSTRSEAEKAEIAALSAACREMGYEYSARYLELFGKRAMDPGFTHGINQAVEAFYKKCVEELHPYNWYHQYPKDIIL